MTTDESTPEFCVICGNEVDGDPDDDQTICGECNRARNFDVLLWEMDAADGELDGEIN